MHVRSEIFCFQWQCGSQWTFDLTIQVFWDVTLYRLIISWATFRRIVAPLLSGSSRTFYSFLTSALWSFETSVITSRYGVTYQKTWIFNSTVVRTSLLALFSAVRRTLPTF